MIRFSKKIALSAVVLLSAVSTASAQNATLDQLLEETRRAATQSGQIDAQRERQFRNQVNQQQQLLAQARRELASAEARRERLSNDFDENERQLAELETVLAERSGNLNEMSGVVKQIARDLIGKLDDSIVSAQYPQRQTFLDELARQKELPNIQELTQLWYELQRELTEQSKVEQFTADVLRPDGQVERDQPITRIGVFNAVSDGRFLQWQGPNVDFKNGILAELSRQPSSRFTGLIGDFEGANQGPIPMAIDFTRGPILSQVVKSKTWGERLGLSGGGDPFSSDAGLIGWVIIGVGLLGLALCLIRGLVLTASGAKIKSQLKKAEPSSGNALGRVMSVYSDNPDSDVETLELKLDEAILRETGPLESGLAFIKMLYVIAPLLGLLGTVVGMINTFQAITLFGTGDPKNMAGGISQALVTTVLGLVVAIPLTFLHSLLQSRSRSLIQILEEQSAGIVARLAEKRDGMTA